MAGGGLALMVVPALTDATSWRAAYWSACAPRGSSPRFRRSLAPGLPRVGHAGAWVLRDRELLPIGVHASCDLRARRGRGQLGRPAPRAEGVGVDRCRGRGRARSSSSASLTRPVGGLLAGRVRGRLLVAAALVGTSRRSAASRAGRPRVAISALGALVLGLTAGMPFAVDLRGRPAHPSRRARRRNRARQRLRGSHDPRRNATRRARLRALERRAARIRRHRRPRRCCPHPAAHGPAVAR